MNRIARTLALVAALCLAPVGGAIAADTGTPAAKAAPILLAQADAKKDEAPAAKAEAAAAEEKKEEAAAAAPPVPNKGDTTWMLVATALVILMTIEALDLGDGDPLHADAGQGFPDFVELEGLDDGGDQFHGWTPALQAARGARGPAPE